jgi:hypothetical protein
MLIHSEDHKVQAWEDEALKSLLHRQGCHEEAENSIRCDEELHVGRLPSGSGYLRESAVTRHQLVSSHDPVPNVFNEWQTLFVFIAHSGLFIPSNVALAQQFNTMLYQL